MSENPNVPGSSLPLSDTVLETGASMTQDFAPIKNVCAYLNAFHIYSSDPSRAVEAQHYCMHITSDVRQCLIFDSPEPHARLIGVEYMITRSLYEGLPEDERKLWHSHVFEVKSGMLIMPAGKLVPLSAWEAAETKEMESVINLYGKTWHMWQVDRGDTLPLGKPELMQSFQHESDGFKRLVEERDRKVGVDYKKKAELRREIKADEKHVDADCWDVSKQL